MKLTVANTKSAERIDRRILGGLQLVDAITELPLRLNAKLQVKSAKFDPALTGDEKKKSVIDKIQIIRNSSGLYAAVYVPHFDDYQATFDQDDLPTDNKKVFIDLIVSQTGPYYFPRTVSIELPRSINPKEKNRVFDPVPVKLFRTPLAPVQHGWASIRVHVRNKGSKDPVPGVLIYVYRRSGGSSVPIGMGMTEWRGLVKGDGLIIIKDIKRFQAGSGNNVTTQSIPVKFKAAKDDSLVTALKDSFNADVDPSLYPNPDELKLEEDLDVLDRGIVSVAAGVGDKLTFEMDI